MNLVDSLLKADVKSVDSLEKGVFKSKKLAKILGAKENTVDIEITEIKPRKINSVMAYQMDSNGKLDFEKSYDANLMICIEGITNPSLKDKDLQSHFGVDSAKDLCEKLFGNEVSSIASAITELSGLSGDEEEEIKNL